jgi:hypothetical protein
MEEFSGREKVMKQKGKLRENGTREDIHRQGPCKIRTRDTEETKNNRERGKREGKEVKWDIGK